VAVPRRAVGRVARGPRLIYGRSYFETLALTLRFMELTGGVEVKESAVMLMEEEICALATVSGSFAEAYIENILKVIEREYPDLPRPEIKGCRAYWKVIEWVYTHLDKIEEKIPQQYRNPDPRKRAAEIATWIARVAQQATLVSLAVITVAPAPAMVR